MGGKGKRRARKKVLYTGSNFQAKALLRPQDLLPLLYIVKDSHASWVIPPSGCLLSDIGIFSLIFFDEVYTK